jgi:hypothetical protein
MTAAEFFRVGTCSIQRSCDQRNAKTSGGVLLATIRFLISMDVYHGKYLRNVPLLE